MSPQPLPDQKADLGECIVGVWGLVSREDHDESGNKLIDPHLGADPIGMLCFSRDHFSAQFAKRDRTDAAPTVAAASENNSSAVNGYDAYFGRYRIDETGEAIVVHLEGSITAANSGHEFTRATRANGDRLIIRLPTATDDGVAITRTLGFERLS